MACWNILDKQNLCSDKEMSWSFVCIDKWVKKLMSSPAVYFKSCLNYTKW